METLGKRIAALRREKELRQDDLAEKLRVSPQAVSKWENDQTCPDITLLPELARILGVTVDELLSGESAKEPDVRLLPKEQKKDINDMILRIEVDSDDGDRVRINLPMGLVQVGLEMGMSLPEVGVDSYKNAIKSIDMKALLEAVRQGAVGNLVEIESDGDRVRIFVE